MTRQTVTIVGSYNVGLFLKGKRLPAPGETVIADEFVEGGGGKGSNQAVAAALFGADVRFVGCVGSDKYGEDALAMYTRLGISIEHVRIDPSIHSGISVILIDENGANLISVAPGANLNLSADDIDAAEPILKRSGVVGFQLENDHDTVFHAIRKTHDLGIQVFLDPAPAVKLPEDLYPHIDIVKPNETEAFILTGIEVADPSSAEAAGKWFVNRGVKTALVTLGAGGVVRVNDTGAEHFAAPKVEAIDSTGAGDIFSGGFLAALASGKTEDEALKWANAAAALSTTKLGVIESIPKVEVVEDFLGR